MTPSRGNRPARSCNGTFPCRSSPGRSRARRTYRVLPALLSSDCWLQTGAGKGNVMMIKPRMRQGVGHRRAARLALPRWLRVFPAVWRALTGWCAGSPVGYGLTESGTGGTEPRGLASGMEYRGRSRRWRCLLGGIGGVTASVVTRADARCQRRIPRTQPPLGATHPQAGVLLPGSRWSSLTPGPQPPRTGMTTGMNGDGLPRQDLTHPIVDNAPRTWDKAPRRSVRPMRYLLPYPWSELERWND